MNFFPIVPFKYLNTLSKPSRHHMVLSHWLSDKHYLKFYQKMWERGDYIILDNGACELGRSVDLDDLLLSFQKLGGTDVLVIPDWPDAPEKNRRLFNRFFEREPEFRAVHNGYKLMAVPHSLEDLEVFAGDQRIDIIGLNPAMERFHGRANVISLHPGLKYHLLGCWRNPIKEIESVRPFSANILGMDSSLPYRVLRTGRDLTEYKPFPKVMDRFESTLSDPMLRHCAQGLKKFAEFVSGV